MHLAGDGSRDAAKVMFLRPVVDFHSHGGPKQLRLVKPASISAPTLPSTPASFKKPLGAMRTASLLTVRGKKIT